MTTPMRLGALLVVGLGVLLMMDPVGGGPAPGEGAAQERAESPEAVAIAVDGQSVYRLWSDGTVDVLSMSEAGRPNARWFRIPRGSRPGEGAESGKPGQ